MNPIVSVPCPTIMPFIPELTDFSIFCASCCQYSGLIFSESISNTISVSRLQISANSGTALNNSPGVKDGITAPVV